MAVKSGRLICVYNLGDGDVEMEVQPFVTQSETEEAVMDQVKFKRYKIHSAQQSFPKHVQKIFY